MTYEHKRTLWREGHFGVEHFGVAHFGVAHFGMVHFGVKKKLVIYFSWKIFVCNLSHSYNLPLCPQTSHLPLFELKTAGYVMYCIKLTAISPLLEPAIPALTSIHHEATLFI